MSQTSKRVIGRTRLPYDRECSHSRPLQKDLPFGDGVESQWLLPCSTGNSLEGLGVVSVLNQFAIIACSFFPLTQVWEENYLADRRPISKEHR